MSDLIAKARETIQQRLDEIEAERRQLEQALKSLQGSSASSRQSGQSSSNGRRRGRRKSAKRSGGPSARTRAAVTEYLQAHPQADTAEVVEALDLKDGRVVGAQRRKLTSS
jgi:cell division septum initiation protein DivIVA